MKSNKPKPRAGGTMTESQFWSMIRSTLREKSRWWKPVSICRDKARRPYKGPKKAQKYEYQCNQCKRWFSGKEINIDHIEPVGTLKSEDDLIGFVNRLFVEADKLQVLCIECHDIKSKEDRLKMSKE